MKEFEEWMRESTTLSESSIYKYAHAVNTIASDMIEAGVIPVLLADMSPLQLDIYVKKILDDASFIAKNTKGNKMYSNALKQYRQYRVSGYVYSEKEITDSISAYPVKNETERAALVKSRIGQGIFKQRLIGKYGSRCLITGIETKKLLIASHVKPWSVCDNQERLSSENGFLLTPTFDKLFDSGLISFADSGNILISTQLPKCDQQKLGISTTDTFDIKTTHELMTNLEYHRDVIFLK